MKPLRLRERNYMKSACFTHFDFPIPFRSHSKVDAGGRGRGGGVRWIYSNIFIYWFQCKLGAGNSNGWISILYVLFDKYCQTQSNHFKMPVFYEFSMLSFVNIPGYFCRIRFYFLSYTQTINPAKSTILLLDRENLNQSKSTSGRKKKIFRSITEGLCSVHVSIQYATCSDQMSAQTSDSNWNEAIQIGFGIRTLCPLFPLICFTLVVVVACGCLTCTLSILLSR